MKLKLITLTLTTLLSLLCAQRALAEHEVEHNKSAGLHQQYISLEPDIITNFHTRGKSLGFLHVRVDLVTSGADNVRLVTLHTPLIRNIIIDVIGEKEPIDIKSRQSKDKLRKECLDRINAELVTETGKNLLLDIIFSKYIYQ